MSSKFLKISLTILVYAFAVTAQTGCQINPVHPGHFELFTYATAANACSIDNLPLSSLVFTE
jgi:hypothetical protein